MTDSLGEIIADSKALAGFNRESLSYLDGSVIEDTINDPWTSAPTATGEDGTQAVYTNVGTTRVRSWIVATGQWRTTRKTSSFGDYGLVTTTEDDGDISDPNQATCTRTTYAQNTGGWLLNFPSRVQKTAGTCGQTPGSGNIIADRQSYYDHLALGAAPTTGDVTKADEMDTWPSGGSETFVSPAASSEYDVYGRVVAATNVLGLTTNTAYTPATGGLVTQIAVTTPPISSTNSTRLTSTKYFDRLSGAVTTEVDNSGLRTDATYDALGRLTAVWHPGHDKSTNAQPDLTFAYAVSNTGPSVVTAKTLLSNAQYATTYSLVDGLGRTVQKQSPTPAKNGGRLLADTFYDSQGRAWKTHDNYWNGDSGPSLSLLVVQDNAVPSTTVTKYDTAGRQVASIYQLYGTEKWRTTTTYGGDRVTTIPPLGGTASTIVTDGLGQKTQLLEYKDRAHTGPGDSADVTTYTYTHTGQLASITDATGKNTWTTGYDLHDRKIASTDPDTGTSHYTYDAAGRLLSSTDGRGRTLAYTYDNLGRKTAEFDGSTSGTKLASWTYDTVMAGKLASSSRFANGKTYTTTISGYDTAGRATGTRITIPITESGLGGNYQFSTTYDPLSGAVHSMTSPAKGGLLNETMLWTYDTLGNPSEMFTADTSGGGTHLVSETDYNAYGQVLRTNFQDAADPHQIAVTSTYDDGTNRLTGTLAERATATDYMITNRAYSYDPSGDITKIADTPLTGAADVQCFGYDYLQRLTQAWTPSSGDCATTPTAAAIGGAAPYWTSWTFDQTGNRLTQVQHRTTGDLTTTSSYPQAGQSQPHALQTLTATDPTSTSVVGYTYDNAGNTVTGGPAGPGQAYTYDAEGRIATATDASGKVSSYTYDVDGNRFLTKDPTGTTLTIGDLEIFVPAGSSSAVATRTYTYNGHPIAERKGNVGLTWLMTDLHDTAYASVNADNLAVTKRWQDPYGVGRGPAPASWPDQHGFLNGYQNTTALVHLGARDYDPVTGRFTTVDPVLKPGDTQQMNGYAYADDNPVSNSDPSGLEPLNSECAGSDMVACREYYYGNWDTPAVQNINLSLAISVHWHSAKMAEYGIMATRASEKTFHPTREQVDNAWRSLIGVAVNVVVFAGCSAVTAPETAGLSVAACGALAGAAGGGVDAAVNDGNVLAAVTEGGLLGFLEGLAGVGVAKLISKSVAPVEEPPAPRPAAPCNSFAAATSVLMADGTVKPIAEVEVGDKVTNAEPDEQGVQQHTVTALHITDNDRDFATVTVATPAGPETIVTTAHHLFWDATTHAWTGAADLKPSDMLDTPGDGHAAVLAVRVYTDTIRTYNLTIDSVHTYYVLAGGTPVLAHNCGTAGRDLDALSQSGMRPAKGKLTYAGREYQKHMDRGDLPVVPGKQLDSTGQDLLDEILTNPTTVDSTVTAGNFSGGKRYIMPDPAGGRGIGATFDSNGNFQYFGRY